MIFTYEQMMFLSKDKDNKRQFIWVGKGEDAAEHIEWLKKQDEGWVKAFGHHLITNYKDLYE